MLHEKMRGDVVGVPGGGGEYLPLDGPFGWSNGVVLKLALLLDFEEDV
jgi:neutral trehalase